MTNNQNNHAKPRTPRPRKSRLPGGGSRRRSAARLAAVQALYMIHIGDQSADDVIRDFLEGRMGGEAIEVDPDTEEERTAALIDFDQELFVSLVRGVLANGDRIDDTVSRSLTAGWQWDRMENTVREILRCGSYEIMERVDVPPRVAINEYVDVAHAFYAGPETRLVNAVLDHLARVVRPNEMERGRDGRPMSGSGGTPSGKVGRGEFALIADLFAPLAIGHPGALNLKDDAAILSVPKGYRLVVTTDAIVAGVHFLPDDPPDLVAKKAVRVNLSDIAAMGAEPLGILVAACFPREGGEAWVEAFARGLSEDVHAYNCPVLGGDTVATPGPATITVTALGCAPAGGELRRDGAREGDVIMVTGTLGDAALGLKVCRGDAIAAALSEAHKAFLVDRYRLPRPRVSFGPVLSGMARSCLDVSDGLVGDLKHICDNSHLGAEVDFDALPLSDAARAAVEADGALMNAVLCGGDDYELLFTLPEERVEQVRAAAIRCGLTATPVGRMVAGTEVMLRRGEGPLHPFTGGASWSHY